MWPQTWLLSVSKIRFETSVSWFQGTECGFRCRRAVINVRSWCHLGTRQQSIRPRGMPVPTISESDITGMMPNVRLGQRKRPEGALASSRGPPGSGGRLLQASCLYYDRSALAKAVGVGPHRQDAGSGGRGVSSPVRQGLYNEDQFAASTNHDGERVDERSDG